MKCGQNGPTNAAQELPPSSRSIEVATNPSIERTFLGGHMKKVSLPPLTANLAAAILGICSAANLPKSS
jgi:hypothetical protein